jgi:hypothetical protein
MMASVAARKPLVVEPIWNTVRASTGAPPRLAAHTEAPGIDQPVVGDDPNGEAGRIERLHPACDRGFELRISAWMRSAAAAAVRSCARAAPGVLAPASAAADVRRCLRPATARPGFPAPIGSEAGAVPAHQRLRSDNLQGVQHPGSQAIEPNKQQAIYAVEGHSLRRVPPQDIEPVPKHKVFGFQRSAGPEQTDQGAPNQPASA